MNKEGGSFQKLRSLKNNKTVINFFSTATMALFLFTSYNFFLKNYEYSGLKALRPQKTIKHNAGKVEINPDLKNYLEKIGYKPEFTSRIEKIQEKYKIKIALPEAEDGHFNPNNITEFQSKEDAEFFLNKLEVTMLISQMFNLNSNPNEEISNFYTFKIFENFTAKSSDDSGESKDWSIVGYADSVGGITLKRWSDPGDIVHEVAHTTNVDEVKYISKMILKILEKNGLKTSYYGGDAEKRPSEVFPELIEGAFEESGNDRLLKRDLSLALMAQVPGYEYYTSNEFITLFEENRNLVDILYLQINKSKKSNQELVLKISEINQRTEELKKHIESGDLTKHEKSDKMRKEIAEELNNAKNNGEEVVENIKEFAFYLILSLDVTLILHSSYYTAVSVFTLISKGGKKLLNRRRYR